MSRQGGVPYSSGIGYDSDWDKAKGFLSSHGSGVGSAIGGLLGDMFGGGKSPMSAANPYLSQEAGDISKYMDPYEEAGKGALGNLGNIYGEMMGSPGEFLNKIGQHYHQSPGFQFAMHQALMGAANTAAAGGMGGSPLAQQQNAMIAEQMANKNYYQWMGQATGMLGKGLQGEMGLAGLGMQGATNMSNVLANQLQEQAAMAYHQQAAKNKASGAVWGDVGSLVGSAAGAMGL